MPNKSAHIHRRAFCIGVTALFSAGCTARAGTNVARRPQPNGIKSLIAEEAQRLRVPVSLALAVAHAESNFDPNALSHKGARGVMQIMPATAWGEYAIEPDLLWQPRVNVRVGLHFLRRLLNRYRGRVELALSYYNGGSAVGDLPNARIIPATRRYVDRVLRLRDHYRYREGWAYAHGANT